jgi:phosphatidylglycerophosphate synthase
MLASPALTALAALLPAVVVLSYFVVGMGAFALRSMVWGVPHDREIESRGQSVLVTFYFRNYFIWVTRPLWRLLLASGVSANTVTGVAAVLGVLSGVAVAAGRFALGGWLFLFSGILDAMDGRLARARGQVAPMGSIVDSVLDRYTDAILLMGLCWYFRTSWMLLPTLAALLGTSLVPYVRAKAEAVGVALRGGLMQRPERILYLGTALALTPIVELVLSPGEPHSFPRLAALGVIFLAVTTNLTAIKRLVDLLRAVSRPRAAEPGSRPAQRRRHGGLRPGHS